VRRTQRIPFSVCRSSALGLPGPRRSGSNGEINLHWASVNSPKVHG